MSLTANAAVTPLTIDGAGIAPVGNTWTSIIPGLTDNGVTFDLTYTITGSANLSVDTAGANGLGVLGGPSDGLNAGETLTFTAAISNVSGGTVTGGLTEIVFDGGTVTLDGSLSDSVTPTFVSNVFAQQLNNNFTGVAAVPEPGSMATLAVLGMGVIVRRRRRS